MRKQPRQAEIELQQSKRMLACDTMNDALHKDRVGLQLSVSMLSGSNVFTPEEKVCAERILKELDEIDGRLLDLYGTAPHGNDSNRVALQVAAKTLDQEIAAHRECAFWMLPSGGVLEMERIISAQLSAYEDVRRLIRIIAAKDSGISTPEDPAPLAFIPRNHYLAFTHPELA